MPAWATVGTTSVSETIAAANITKIFIVTLLLLNATLRPRGVLKTKLAPPDLDSRRRRRNPLPFDQRAAVIGDRYDEPTKAVTVSTNGGFIAAINA